MLHNRHYRQRSENNKFLSCLNGQAGLYSKVKKEKQKKNKSI